MNIFSLRSVTRLGVVLLTGLTIATVTPISLVQAQPASARIESFPALENLNLTDDQKSQLQEINQQVLSQVESILTFQQRTQFRSTVQQSGMQTALRQLNLTRKQQSQLRKVMKSAKREIDGVLTDEQKQQLQQQMNSRRGNRPF